MAGIFRPYALPLRNQILPKALLSEAEQQLVDDEEFVKTAGFEVEQFRNAFMYAMWFSISAKFKDYGYQRAVEVQFEAVEQDDGRRGLNEPVPTNVYGSPPPLANECASQARRAMHGNAATYDSWDTFWAPWFGCRCSWPMTQQCWYLCYGAQVAQWFAVWFTFSTVVFQIAILDAMVEANYLAIVPHTTTWTEWFYSDTPLVPRLVWMIGKLFIFWYVVGIAENTPSSRGFLASAQIRTLLATMANRYEGQTYAYFTVFIWTIIVELETVVLNAYLPLISAVIITSESTGVAINDASVILLVFQFIPTLQFWAMGFIAFATCLDKETYTRVSMYVAGERVRTLERVFSYVTLWWTSIWTVVILILFHYSYNAFYLWVIPISALYFMLMWQTVPYCLEGWPTCYPHSGPCVVLAAIGTTLIWVMLFVTRHGCLLFPCVCAPEVPGWMFFPPTDELRNPLRGAWDVRLPALFIERVLGLSSMREWDCAWVPQPSDYEEFYPSVGLLTGGEMAQMAQGDVREEIASLREEVRTLEATLAMLVAR